MALMGSWDLPKMESFTPLALEKIIPLIVSASLS
jgi:hypothetical protein